MTKSVAFYVKKGEIFRVSALFLEPTLEKLHVTRVSYSPSYTTKYLFGSKKRKVKAATQQEIYLLLVFFFMIQLFVWIPTWRVH